MNDDFRLKLIKMRDEKVAHLNELLSMKTQGLSAKWVSEDVDIEGMIAREQLAIDNLDDTIARLS
ncbi:hypothetical protein DTW90_24530 [Neorhizobium sp. P12A]|uniref:hypothetical protein n=1 Tax=Rhizobium/Agrobacterium group TaxID=227290 RepID=UPI00104A27EC|nr:MULTISPECIES: hypothetical protein [Rhizobium/Agrobacterium group]KAA0694484.1 hypothetical protein DTW90_24530 [Neorhizobium sp. P12A]TCR85369.1 hypothetical protein EV561_107141 [Rhizobium sp. BK376]